MICYGFLILMFLVYGLYEVVVFVFCIFWLGEEWGNVVFVRCVIIVFVIIVVNVCVVVVDLVFFIMFFFIIVGLMLSWFKKKGLLVVFLVGFL